LVKSDRRRFSFWPISIDFFFLLFPHSDWQVSVDGIFDFFKMIDCFTYQFLFLLPVVWVFVFILRSIWSIEYLWAVSSVFSEHIMISFSHLFHLSLWIVRRNKKIINLELSAFRCQTSIIQCIYIYIQESSRTCSYMT